MKIDERGRPAAPRIPGRVKGGSIGILLLALVGMYFGIDPRIILNMGESVQVSCRIVRPGAADRGG